MIHTTNKIIMELWDHIIGDKYVAKKKDLNKVIPEDNFKKQK